MSPEQFYKLLEILCPDLEVNEQKSRNSTSGNTPIVPEIVLCSTLRFLAGGRIVDVISIYGISVNSGEQIIVKCLDAINDCPHPSFLSIMLPDPKDHKALHIA